MLVTINTDAGYNHEFKCGAWACWIVSNEGKLICAEALKSVNNSTDAEIQAIGNALFILSKKEWEFTKVIINTDALSIIEGKFIHPNSKFPSGVLVHKIMVEIANKLHKKVKEVFEFRHVKAHTKADNSRKWVNKWCDKQVKIHLRKQYQK